MKLKCGAEIKIVGAADGIHGPTATCNVQDKHQTFPTASSIGELEEQIEDENRVGAVSFVISLKAIPALRLFLDRVERRLQRLAKS
jgi:hypothetical protein